MSVAAVFLDCGGVLQLPDPDRVAAAFGSAGVSVDGLDLDRVHYEAISAVDALGPEAVDRSIWEVFVGVYVSAADPPPEHAGAARRQLASAFADSRMWSRTVPGSVEALRRLGAAAPIAIVSNSDGALEDRLREEGICQVGPGPGVPVGAVVDSGAVGVSKPDPRIFAIALERMGIDAAGVVHVGDSVRADIEGARRAGLSALHLDPYALCEADHDHVRSVDEVATRIAG